MTGPPDRSWTVEHHTGSATGFHRRDLPDPVPRALWWFEVAGPAVVLGSTQQVEAVDVGRARAAGVEVVRRRSGGGAVWLAPGEVTWVDVVLPRHDPLWDDDVGHAARWLGAAWARALLRAGVAGARPHDGPMAPTADSPLVCFAGLAPGEVTVGGRKVVGVAQRRTRAGARFQCAVLHRWDPEPLVDLLARDPGERTALADRLRPVAAGIGPVDSADLVAALHAELTIHG